MSYGEGIGEAFGCLITVAVIGVVGFFILLGFNLFSAEKVESKELITPKIRLEVVDNKVDTIYVYEAK
jgi:putative effector of murein hydrolase LrgA (UPF0299 family)